MGDGDAGERARRASSSTSRSSRRGGASRRTSLIVSGSRPTSRPAHERPRRVGGAEPGADAGGHGRPRGRGGGGLHVLRQAGALAALRDGRDPRRQPAAGRGGGEGGGGVLRVEAGAEHGGGCARVCGGAGGVRGAREGAAREVRGVRDRALRGGEPRGVVPLAAVRDRRGPDRQRRAAGGGGGRGVGGAQLVRARRRGAEGVAADADAAGPLAAAAGGGPPGPVGRAALRAIDEGWATRAASWAWRCCSSADSGLREENCPR